MATRALDTVITFRVLKLLTTPWKEHAAFKQGLIDEKGKRTKKKPKSSQDKDAYTFLHRLVFNLRRIMEMIPFGKTRIGSYAAALFLVKEHAGITGTQLDKEVFKHLQETGLLEDDLLEEFVPIFNKRYAEITNNKEPVSINYKSQLAEKPLSQLLEDQLQKDMVLQYTSVGTHKDDLSFEIEGHPIKKFGSQGQQKSFLVALKLAQFDFIKKISGVNPILLLDDVFDKLDEQRVAHIVALVATKDLGQIFISDTHAERTEKVVKESNQTYKIFKL